MAKKKSTPTGRSANPAADDNDLGTPLTPRHASSPQPVQALPPAGNQVHPDSVEAFKAMLLPRLIEERMLKLLRQNRISKWFSGMGQEAIAVGVALAAHERDPMFTMHRNLGVFTTRDVPFYPLFCQLMGRKDGFTHGRERSFHFGIPEHRIYGMISHLAATMPIADGVALAGRMRDTGEVVFSFCGDGATSEGDFHEALNLAAVWKLPVVFIIENNGYGLSTPTSQQYACEHLSDRAAGYGMEGMRVDGNELHKVMEAVAKARESASQGKPVLLEFLTFRQRGHEEASGTAYVPKELMEHWMRRDPVELLRERLRAKELLDPERERQIESELKARFETDLLRALEAAEPEFDAAAEGSLAGLAPMQPATGAGTTDLPGHADPVSDSGMEQEDGPEVEKRFVDAIQDALRQSMRESPQLVLMGQDIADYGGVFKVTEGFLEAFGEQRVRNTPIIESGAIGAAIGLAMEGFPAMVEMQFADFISCGFNQIVNNLSKGRYRWMPPLNVTIRAPHGAGVGAGPFHSQSPEGWFMAHPGMRIVVPATVADAQDMLWSALRDPNPVLFFEHKKLYRSLRSVVPELAGPTDLSRAAVRRAGSDVSVITYGFGVHWALEQAESWQQNEGVSIEVVDLRSLSPLDMDTVLGSVRKTGRVLLLEEAPSTMGPMAELSARIVSQAFEHLDAPILRCSSLDMPIPFNRNLERGYLPEERLSADLRRILAY